MSKYFTNFILVFLISILSETLYAQKDVTQFLGIPIDGYKPEMVKKLKDKGFTSSATNKDILEGEFNGINVNIFIVTNNNKVCRIMVAEANTVDEGDIKLRFNKLLQQFQSNKKYLSTSDSIIAKWVISEKEDVFYEMSVNKKRYEALFYQKTAVYDSLIVEKDKLLTQTKISDTTYKKLNILISRIAEESFKSFDKPVWFMINSLNGKFYITIYYDNEFNRAKGDDL